MNQNTIQIWGIIGTWVAGIGTVSAVIVSLWLAYNQNKVKLKISAGLRQVFRKGAKLHPEYCNIHVVNIGNRPLIITGIGWETGKGKNKKRFYQFCDKYLSNDLPKTLRQCEEANFFIPLNMGSDEKDWVVQLPELLAGNEEKIDNIKKLKTVVNTSIGQVFKAHVEKRLVEKLLKSYKMNCNK